MFFNVYYIGRLMNLILYPAMKLTQFFKRGDVSLSFKLSLIWLFFSFLPPLSFDGKRNVVCSKFIYLWKTFVPEREM